MLAAQVARMTADPKARRLATEFFGQWLGFYHFDEYRGVDTGRFPEFTDEVKRAMYDEAVSTFEYMVRERRPVKEILHADYTFLNQPLAKFYGLDERPRQARRTRCERVDGANAFDRGGALRLGAVLTTTSAPLRTSPVKRGDWILRRILSTPTPPPPANAGTLPADDKSFEGQTLRERLTAHKRDAKCASCHLRIDPLGFPLEGFDAVGRTRTAYNDGKPVDTTGEFRDKTDDRRGRRAAGLPAEAGRAGDDDAVAQDDWLRPRAHAAAVRSAADWRDGQGRRRRHRSPTWPRASSPAASSATAPAAPTCRPRPAAAHAPDSPTTSGARTTHDHRRPSARQLPASFPARRRRRPGAAVARVAAGCSRRQRLPPKRAGASGPPLRMGIVFFSNGVEPAHWWAKGSGATMELGPAADADAAAPRGHGLHPGPVQPVGVRLDQPAPRAHEPAVGRAHQPRSRT